MTVTLKPKRLKAEHAKDLARQLAGPSLNEQFRQRAAELAELRSAPLEPDERTLLYRTGHSSAPLSGPDTARVALLLEQHRGLLNGHAGNGKVPTNAMESTTADSLRLSEIVVGERRREQMGDIAGLATSIDRWGLLHPVVVDAHNKLVAGERRLRACQQLGWQEIPIRRLGDLTPIELREIELEENLRRKDLTPGERTKLTLEQLEVSEKLVHRDRQITKNNFDFTEVKNPKRGRPKAASSERAIAGRMGISQGKLQKAKQHKTAFERFPFLEQPHWTQAGAIEAFKLLADLPEKDRDRAAKMIDQPATPPASALTMLKTLGNMQAKHREAVFADFESGDEKRQSDATCCAAAKPPMPDPRIVENEAILRQIAKAEKFGKAAEYRAAQEAIETLQTRLRKEYDREAKALARRRGTA